MVEIADWNKLEVHRVNIGQRCASLIGCEYMPWLQPTESPWERITEEIKDSSIVMVEYFPPELQRTVFNYPIKSLSRYAESYADSYGITDFFNRVASIAAEQGKPVAVSDNANNMNFEYYYRVPSFLTLPPLGYFAANFSSVLSSGHIDTLSLLAGLVGLAGVIDAVRDFEEGRVRVNYERYYPNIVDSRRLITARGIEQEEGVLYIAPHAHVNRVKWYLENPDDIFSKVKGKIYSALPGLPKSTRIYQFSDQKQDWTKTADHAIRL